jgi:hypothetical protein
LNGNQLAGMTQVIRGRVDQCVSASAERAREITRIVAIKHGDPRAKLDKLLRRRTSTTVGSRDVPAGGKKLPCHRIGRSPHSSGRAPPVCLCSRCWPPASSSIVGVIAGQVLMQRVVLFGIPFWARLS